jgi:hypothetical protein
MSNTIEVKIDDDELYSAFLRESEGMGLSVEAAVAEAIREWLLVLKRIGKMWGSPRKESPNTKRPATRSKSMK